MTDPNNADVYPGTELELFAQAHNWRQYWMRQIVPFLGNRTLEVGAGIGSITRELAPVAKSDWFAIEPDPTLVQGLHTTVIESQLENVTVMQGNIHSINSDEGKFNSILYSDVLEHIRDDEEEVEFALSKLEVSGHLILLVPAHQFLYSDFDKAIGHYRRYSRRMVRALIPNSASIVLDRYLDSVGVTLSLGNRLITRRDKPTPKQISIWDRAIIPASRILDPFLRYRLGKSLLIVIQKN